MTREEAIINLKLSQNRIGGIKKEEWNALQMAIEALQTDTVSREEYEELYRKAKEVNGMANDILADFPSYKELISVVRCKDCRHYGIGNCYMYGGQMNEDDFCSYGERRK